MAGSSLLMGGKACKKQNKLDAHNLQHFRLGSIRSRMDETNYLKPFDVDRVDAGESLTGELIVS